MTSRDKQSSSLSHLAVHENVVCAERSVNQAVFVHELQTLQDLVSDLQHLLWATTKQNKTNNEPICLQGRGGVGGQKKKKTDLRFQFLFTRNTTTVQQRARLLFQKNAIKRYEEENDDKLT